LLDLCPFQSKTFTAGQRIPSTVNVTYSDGIYAFDSASSELKDVNILMWMVGVWLFLD
jgi:hypothetical protein